ncbi:MAG: HEAT repeat domain-containing protein [Planctomycetota bacterium]|nr:MAG: HEAT repeat domain-containing protein [Planctomycetota bacterium]
MADAGPRRSRKGTRSRGSAGGRRRPGAAERSETASGVGSEPPSSALGSESAASGRPSLKSLVHELRRGGPEARAEAAARIGRLGAKARKAAPYVVRALRKDDDEAVRLRCAQALGRLGDPSAAPALLDLLEGRGKDRSRDAKTLSGAAAKALKKIGPPVVPHLFAALGRKGLRRKALRLLKSVPPAPGGEAVDAFASLLEEADESLACEAVDALAVHGAAAVPCLLAAVADEREAVYSRGLGALRGMGKAAVPPLARALGSASARARASAARALGSIAKHVGQRPVARVLDRLLDALVDGDPLVRSSAAQALGNLGEHEQRVLPPLVKALGDEDASVSMQVVLAILALAQDKAALVERMVAVLEGSRRVYTRVGSCMVLMHLGADAKAAVPALVAALDDAAAEVREYAHLALQTIRTPSMRLEVIRTASMRLRVVSPDEARPAPKKPRAPRKRTARTAQRRRGPRRR